jgi:hypothetical protein
MLFDIVENRLSITKIEINQEKKYWKIVELSPGVNPGPCFNKQLPYSVCYFQSGKNTIVITGTYQGKRYLNDFCIAPKLSIVDGF